MGHNPWGRKESDMAERLSTAQHQSRRFDSSCTLLFNHLLKSYKSHSGPPVLQFCFLQFQLPVIIYSLKMLNGKFHKLAIHVLKWVGAVLSSMMKSGTILIQPVQDKNYPFVRHILPVSH